MPKDTAARTCRLVTELLKPFSTMLYELMFIHTYFNRRIPTANSMRRHKTNMSTTQYISQPLRVNRQTFARAAFDLCMREDRIMSVTDDLRMREGW